VSDISAARKAVGWRFARQSLLSLQPGAGWTAALAFFALPKAKDPRAVERLEVLASSFRAAGGVGGRGQPLKPTDVVIAKPLSVRSDRGHK
jgi:hypothetical protein